MDMDKQNRQKLKKAYEESAYEVIQARKHNFITEDFGSTYRTSEKFIHFGYIGEELDGLPSLKAGWKFHLAIDDSDKDNLINAWNAIRGVLIKFKIPDSKVVKLDADFYKDPIQHGKQVTIYYYQRPNLNWQRILTKITEKLVAANIKPDYRAPSDKRLSNNAYITYRNDANPNGEYHRDDTNYNPFGFPDIFENLTIEVRGQPEPLEPSNPLSYRTNL